MKFGKITIIGAGRVGTSTAFSLICQNIARDVSLLDIDEDILEAQCLDLRDSKYFSFTGHVHKGKWEEAKNSQIIVICAGEVLRPESSLHEVVTHNKRVLDDIFGKLGTLNPRTVVVVATSPVDAMTQYTQKLCGLPKNQVLGTGTLLDTQRLRVKLGKKLGVNEKSVHAYVMGEKGDTAFVPWSHSSIAGRKVTEFFSEDKETQFKLLNGFVEKIKAKTDKMLQSKYGTNFGIAACIAAICKDIIYDTNCVFPLSCWVEEYGCYMSVLCTLGEQGITKILPLDISENEKMCFQKCANTIWHSLKYLGFQREGYGAVGEGRESFKETKEGLGTTELGKLRTDLGETRRDLGETRPGLKETSPLLGETKGLEKTREGLRTTRTGLENLGQGIEGQPGAPGGGLATDTSITGTSRDLGKGPEIGGGLGTDLGGFGKTGFEPEGFKESDIGTKPEEKPMTQSFGGGPGIIGQDLEQGKQKDTGGDLFGGEKKKLVTDTTTPEQTVGRPIRQ